MTTLRAQFMRPGFKPIGLSFHDLLVDVMIGRRPAYWPDAPACRQCICSNKRRKKK